MKQYTLIRCAAFLGALLLLPALPAIGTGHPAADSILPAHSSGWVDLPHPPDSSENLPAPPDPPPEIPKKELTLPHSYKILDAGSGKVLSLSPFEYICGVTAAEIPITFHPEALKAQAVAAHSYALGQMGLQLRNPDPALKGAFLSTDPAHFQAYLSPSERKTLWGTQYNENEKKLEEAVSSVIGQILVNNGEPAAAAFHSISSGRTEAAADVWGQSIPYLIPVDSPEDIQNEHMLSSLRLTVQEAAASLSASLDSLSLPENPAEWFSVLKRTDSGMVQQVSAGKEVMTGERFRNIFGLASANFDISWDGDLFTITVKGRGHGVGMSQWGADSMAQNGSSWTEILFHYYPGTRLMTAAS